MIYIVVRRILGLLRWNLSITPIDVQTPFRHIAPSSDGGGIVPAQPKTAVMQKKIKNCKIDR